MICDKKMSFEECELAILRAAIDKAEEKQGKKKLHSTEIINIIDIVEEFLKTEFEAGRHSLRVNKI